MDTPARDETQCSRQASTWSKPAALAMLCSGLFAIIWLGVYAARALAPRQTANVAAGHNWSGESSGKHEQQFVRRRREMVDQQLRGRGISDERVLAAMQKVPRHRFVPDDLQAVAYHDSPQPIGHKQTISQPYTVALMTELVRPTPAARALDVGTGSGYQAAVLAELCNEVYSIEILPPLATEARERLQELGYDKVSVRCGDGYRGWPEQAPFDLIVVAAAPDHVPEPLLEQLAIGGRLVIPVGRFRQDLLLFEKQADGTIQKSKVVAVAFVPMTGEAQRADDTQ